MTAFWAVSYTHLDVYKRQVRTSGEQRLSNFLLWQSAYAELVFLDVLWPDFGPAHFSEALAEFNRRERRFGARPG